MATSFVIERVVGVVVLSRVRGERSSRAYGLVDHDIARSRDMDAKTVHRAIIRDNLGTATEMRMDSEAVVGMVAVAGGIAGNEGGHASVCDGGGGMKVPRADGRVVGAMKSLGGHWAALKMRCMVKMDCGGGRVVGMTDAVRGRAEHRGQAWGL